MTHNNGKMSRGGIYDHLTGGFHRYSVDERWVVPHFEKMSYDNSELLKNYVHAFQSSAEPECERIARECMRWIDEWMSDRARGGFYASQDADFSLDDDGDYFTWTRAEAAAVLTTDEMKIAEPFFDIGPVGDMHHNSEKNVLHLEQPLETVAKNAGITPEQAAALILSAKSKLYAARKLRPTPYVDKTVYTGWNALMVSAYLLAGRVLNLPAATTFALKSLDRALTASWNGTSMAHVVSYGEGVDTGAPVIGVLEDYVFTAHAALDAWECTGSIQYFNAALALAEAVLDRFYDDEKGGFFDTENATEPQLGALGTRRKPLQDSPTPAGNSVAAALLLRLAELTGREDLRARAKATLECFAGVVEHFGLYAASYGLALRRMTTAPVQVIIVGQDAMADQLDHPARHDPTNYGMVSVPHGPETGDESASFPYAHNAANEKEIFRYLLEADDQFDDHVYWADLPFWKRVGFVNRVNNQEAKKELAAIGTMAKKDPLSPVGWYFRNAVLPGAGLGLEGYVPPARQWLARKTR